MSDSFWKELNVGNPPKPNTSLSVINNNETFDSQKEEDLSLSRDTIRDLITKGTDVLEDLIYVAKNEQSPRMYEVVSQLIKTISESAKDLQDFHEKKNKTTNNRKSDADIPNPIQVDKAVFVGRNVELIEELKKQKNNK